MKKLILFAILVVATGMQFIQAQTFIREFVAPDPTGQFNAANTAEPLNPGTTYQVYQSGNKYYLTCSRNCPTPTVVTPPPVTPVIIQQPQQGCNGCISVDDALRLVEENRRMAETILKYQQGGGNGGSQGGMSQAELYAYERQFALAEEQLRIQKRQGIGTILTSAFLGLGNLGMQGWNNWMVRQGMYRSVQTTNVFPWQQGNDGGFIPDDRLPVGGGNNNSNLDPFYPNFSGQNGSSGTSFSNNNSSNQFIPGDNNAVGGRYVYRQSR